MNQHSLAHELRNLADEVDGMTAAPRMAPAVSFHRIGRLELSPVRAVDAGDGVRFYCRDLIVSPLAGAPFRVALFTAADSAPSCIMTPEEITAGRAAEDEAAELLADGPSILPATPAAVDNDSDRTPDTKPDVKPDVKPIIPF